MCVADENSSLCYYVIFNLNPVLYSSLLTLAKLSIHIIQPIIQCSITLNPARGFVDVSGCYAKIMTIRSMEGFVFTIAILLPHFVYSLKGTNSQRSLTSSVPLSVLPSLTHPSHFGSSHRPATLTADRIMCTTDATVIPGRQAESKNERGTAASRGQHRLLPCNSPVLLH